MSLVSLLLLLLLAASGSLTAPAQRSAVAQLALPASNYLPPKVKLPQPLATTTSAAVVETQAPVTEALATVAPTNSGYVYRTVRRLKYRRQRVRRDVSHLAMAQYLPPRETYLPPDPTAMALLDDTVEVNAAMPEDALRVYLAPEAETEVPHEADTAAPLETSDEEAETAAPAAVLPKEAEAEPQNSALLAPDGYHYKRPTEGMPMPAEYLPPLQKEQTVAEGPAEGAVLTDDGYHYRTIRCLKF